jgi:hypothetical protein
VRLLSPVLLSLIVLSACAQRSTVAIAAANPCPTNVPWTYPPVPQLNTELWQFSKSHLGTQVGSGQCAELPNVALRQYGGATVSDLGPTGASSDYVWGDLVQMVTPQAPRLMNALPGDVIQFQNASFRWQETNRSWETAIDTHHTAVVQAVSPDGAHLCVFQENAGGQLYVTNGYFEVAGMTGGVMHVYRPRQKMIVR